MITVCDLRKKWRNIRDAFAKELRLQRNEMSGTAARKKYIYFHKLDFLLQELDFRSSDDQYKFHEETAENSYCSITSDGTEDVEYSEYVNVSLGEATKYEIEMVHNTSEDSRDSGITTKTSENMSFSGGVQGESEEPNISEVIPEEFERADYSNTSKESDESICSHDLDEDQSFFNLLLPSVKAFSSRQKCLFKIEVLKAMDKVHCMSAEQLGNYSFELPHFYSNKRKVATENTVAPTQPKNDTSNITKHK